MVIPPSFIIRIISITIIEPEIHPIPLIIIKRTVVITEVTVHPHVLQVELCPLHDKQLVRVSREEVLPASPDLHVKLRECRPLTMRPIVNRTYPISHPDRAQTEHPDTVVAAADPGKAATVAVVLVEEVQEEAVAEDGNLFIFLHSTYEEKSSVRIYYYMSMLKNILKLIRSRF